MLVHWEGKDSGIYEYDQESGRWEYLLNGGYNEAGYDAAGRVIILTQYAVLVYDRGNIPPGRITTSSATTTPVVSAPIVSDESARQFAQLVKELDADKYAQREDATKKLIAMGKPIIPLLREQVTASTNSLEVTERLTFILGKLAPPIPTAAAPRPVSLLRRMHPSLTTRPAAAGNG